MEELESGLEKGTKVNNAAENLLTQNEGSIKINTVQESSASNTSKTHQAELLQKKN